MIPSTTNALRLALCLLWTTSALKLDSMSSRNTNSEDSSVCWEDMARLPADLQMLDENETAHRKIDLSQASDRFSHLRNRKVLFVGDSSVQELMWHLVWSLNGSYQSDATQGNDSVPGFEVPVQECGNSKCLDVCDERTDNRPEEQSYHFASRCALSSKSQCQDALPQVKAHNFSFSFLWSGGPSVCCNGYPGLWGAVNDEHWLNLFKSYAADAPYDDIVFTAGLHDFLPHGKKKNYLKAVTMALDMLEPLATHHVFLAPAAGQMSAMPWWRPYEKINTEVLSSHSAWRVVQRVKYHDNRIHCSTSRGTPSSFSYNLTQECYDVLGEIFLGSSVLTSALPK